MSLPPGKLATRVRKQAAVSAAKTYKMQPRDEETGEPSNDTASVEVAGGGMAGLKATGQKSDEGIPYADLGTMNVGSRVKNLGKFAHPPKKP